MRNFHFPGRSPVYAQRAMVACSHPAATLTAIETLRRGGNAVDASIAAAAVLAVVEPQMTGIGGDCFALIARPGRKIVALNASGRAPNAATAAYYANQSITTIEVTSPHAVTVPGAIDGWATLLKDYGTMSFADLLGPAIELAEKGSPVAPRVASDWARLKEKIDRNPGARKHLLKDGRVPAVGEIMKYPALAKTLKRIAAEGRDAFYEGEIAEDMVAELKALGGLHAVEDFKAQRSSYVEPISVPYKGVELHELPPNNHGIVALMMLKILERTGLPKNPASAERYHVAIEAARLAYAARDTWVADPEMAKVPVTHMLSDSLADDLAKRISRKKRKENLGPLPEPQGTDTVYLSIVDEKGMAVSFINSLFAGFGSGIVTRKSGITLHNRGQGFVLDPTHRNCIAPRKRPLHTLVPAMATRNGKLWASFGVMGAAFQPMGHMYMMTNMVDYGMDPQEALDHPRAFFENGRVELEQSVPAEAEAGLKAMGHPVAWRAEPWGGGQIVAFDRSNGTLIGASDARKDGLALGY